jgi:uncharacterized protein YebE (UPF0316 family)
LLRQIASVDPLRFTRLLFFLNTILWLAFGVSTVAGVVSSYQEDILMQWMVAIMMFGNAYAMMISGIGILSGRKIFYLLALTVIIVNIILTFTDQFGLFDFITLVLDGVILALLIASWGRFFSSESV